MKTNIKTTDYYMQEFEDTYKLTIKLFSNILTKWSQKYYEQKSTC